MKQQRLKEGEINNAGLYYFHHNFGQSRRFIRDHIHQEYTGHYYHINRATSIIRGRVTFPSSAQQVAKTIKGKIYYKSRPVVLPEHEFINNLTSQTVIITNLSEISSLPATSPINSSRLSPAVELLLLLSKTTTLKEQFN